MSNRSKLYESLTQQQQQFYEEKTFSGTQKIKAWIGFLSKISVLDKLGDGKVKSLQTAMIVCIVGAVLSIFAAIFIGEFLVLIPTVIFIAAAIITYKQRKTLQENDINNYLRQFFLPVLHVLKDKVSPDSKLSAKLLWK